MSEPSNLPPLPPGFVCPVMHEAQKVLAASGDLTRALRRLRKRLDYCASCDYEGHCPVIQDFHRQVKAAIAQVAAELKLTL